MKIPDYCIDDLNKIIKSVDTLDAGDLFLAYQRLAFIQDRFEFFEVSLKDPNYERLLAVKAHVEILLVKKLAEYEKMSDDVVATEDLLREWIFEKQKAEVIFALEDNREVGFALFFHNFSTFVGRAGIYLEDLFVLPEYRKRGHGKALILELARIAVERKCGRMEWSCLDWNQPSIDFYLSLGAKPMNEWTTYRLAGDALDKCGKR